MKIDRRLKNSLGLLTLVGALLSLAAPANADTYHVSIDTGDLVSNVNGPYTLDLQLNYGSGPFGNNATISNINFGAGSASEAPTLFGTAAGSADTSFTMSDDNNDFSNEIWQGFTPGSTLSFDLMLSNNTVINTPDGFDIAIFDGNLNNLPTNSPEGLSQLAEFSIGGLGQVDQKIEVATYPATGDYTGVTITVAAAPEPSSWALAGLCVGLFAWMRRRSVRA